MKKKKKKRKKATTKAVINMFTMDIRKVSLKGGHKYFYIHNYTYKIVGSYTDSQLISLIRMEL